MKSYLTVNEVAKIFGVTPLTVRNWDKNGKMPAYRNPINNYRVYKSEDVQVLLRKIGISKSESEKSRKIGAIFL